MLYYNNKRKKGDGRFQRAIPGGLCSLYSLEVCETHAFATRVYSLHCKNLLLNIQRITFPLSRWAFLPKAETQRNVVSGWNIAPDAVVHSGPQLLLNISFLHIHSRFPHLKLYYWKVLDDLSNGMTEYSFQKGLRLW